MLNPTEQPVIAETQVFSFLNKRQQLLDGVCISGGEPTIQEGLIDFIYKVKEKGFAVKLDTNGYRPDVLKSLISRNLLDYIAMDIKSSPAKYDEAAGVDRLKLSLIEESARILLEGSLPYEFRTTVVKELHDPSDFTEIGKWLRGAPKYFIQNFKASGDVIARGLNPCSKEELEAMLLALRQYIPAARLRGED